MHAVGRHGRLRHIAVLVEDASLVCLTDQLGGAGAALGGVEGLQSLIEFGVVKVAGQAAGGLGVGVRCSPRARSPPHVI